MTSIHERERANALMVARAAIAKGYRAFLAESGTYGFYTDAEGTRVVCFQSSYSMPCVSGNYVTSCGRETGSGWQIDDGFSAERVDDYFQARPPHWAVKNHKWRYATLEDHLQRYGVSSRYVEVAETGDPIAQPQPQPQPAAGFCPRCQGDFDSYGQCHCLDPITQEGELDHV